MALALTIKPLQLLNAPNIPIMLSFQTRSTPSALATLTYPPQPFGSPANRPTIPPHPLHQRPREYGYIEKTCDILATIAHAAGDENEKFEWRAGAKTAAGYKLMYAQQACQVAAAEKKGQNQDGVLTMPCILGKLLGTDPRKGHEI
ncbi:hypothetical protein F66182_11229 [Fusarium sp. NRRL 66182]|nr:hypothetical protein F66182_11229 [Fusarium sp. NRRL 66182]